MLNAHSPLGTDARFECDGVILSEAPNFILTQVAGKDKALKKAFGKLPPKVGVVLEHDDGKIMRIGPQQIWVLGEAVAPSHGIYITAMSSAPTRIKLEGLRARDVLARCALIDFDRSQFKPGHFVLTGIHHTPVTIQCTEENTFHIYVLRTFALNIWEWLCDVAQSSGY